MIRPTLQLLAFLAAACLCACSSSSPPPPPLHAYTITLKVPTAGWNLQPKAVYRLDEDRYAAIFQLEPPEDMAAQVISEVSAAVQFPIAEAQHEPKIETYVLGKTWNWNANPDTRFIDSLDALSDSLQGAARLEIDSPQ